MGYAVTDALDGAADGGAGTGDGGVDGVPEGVEDAHFRWWGVKIVVIIFGVMDYGCLWWVVEMYGFLGVGVV